MRALVEGGAAVGDQVVFRFGLETPDLLGARPHAVILDGETMPYVDVTAITMLEQLAGDLERNGVQLVLARDIGTVRDVRAATVLSRSEAARGETAGAKQVLR